MTFVLGCGMDRGDGTHGIGQERNGDTPAPGRIDDGDCTDGGGGSGDDEDCDPSVPGTHTGCHSRSGATTGMTSLATTAMDQPPSHARHDYDSHRNCRCASAGRSSEHRPTSLYSQHTRFEISSPLSTFLCVSPNFPSPRCRLQTAESSSRQHGTAATCIVHRRPLHVSSFIAS